MSTFGLELATDFTGAQTPLNHWTCIDGSTLQHDVCTMLPDQRCVHFWGKCHMPAQTADQTGIERGTNGEQTGIKRESNG